MLICKGILTMPMLYWLPLVANGTYPVKKAIQRSSIFCTKPPDQKTTFRWQQPKLLCGSSRRTYRSNPARSIIYGRLSSPSTRMRLCSGQRKMSRHKSSRLMIAGDKQGRAAMRTFDHFVGNLAFGSFSATLARCSYVRRLLSTSGSSPAVGVVAPTTYA